MIALENISFGYRKNQTLFSGLTLDFAPGHIHGLLGKNGTGKTTLLHILTGLIDPRQGGVRIDEQDPARRQPSCYDRILFVPEEFDLPAITFRCFARMAAPFHSRFSGEALSYYTEQFEVDRSVRLDRLSMGQRKRAFLAFALACNPEYLILDEPTNGLDIPSKAIFRSAVAGFADADKTVIISTHQVRDVENLVDHVTILDEKGLLLHAPTEAIARKLYFGPVAADDETLYAEDSIAGRVGVAVNRTTRESQPDLELLFQAGVRNRELLSELMRSGSSVNS